MFVPHLTHVIRSVLTSLLYPHSHSHVFTPVTRYPHVHWPARAYTHTFSLSLTVPLAHSHSLTLDTAVCTTGAQGHGRPIIGVRLIPGTPQLLTVDDGSTCKLWDIRTCVCLSGLFLMLWGGTDCVWRADVCGDQRHWPPHPSLFSFLPYPPLSPPHSTTPLSTSLHPARVHSMACVATFFKPTMHLPTAKHSVVETVTNPAMCFAVLPHARRCLIGGCARTPTRKRPPDVLCARFLQDISGYFRVRERGAVAHRAVVPHGCLLQPGMRGLGVLGGGAGGGGGGVRGERRTVRCTVRVRHGLGLCGGSVVDARVGGRGTVGSAHVCDVRVGGGGCTAMWSPCAYSGAYVYESRGGVGTYVTVLLCTKPPFSHSLPSPHSPPTLTPLRFPHPTGNPVHRHGCGPRCADMERGEWAPAEDIQQRHPPQHHRHRSQRVREVRTAENNRGKREESDVFWRCRKLFVGDEVGQIRELNFQNGVAVKSFDRCSLLLPARATSPVLFSVLLSTPPLPIPITTLAV